MSCRCVTPLVLVGLSGRKFAVTPGEPVVGFDCRAAEHLAEVCPGMWHYEFYDGTYMWSTRWVGFPDMRPEQYTTRWVRIR